MATEPHDLLTPMGVRAEDSVPLVAFVWCLCCVGSLRYPGLVGDFLRMLEPLFDGGGAAVLDHWFYAGCNARTWVELETLFGLTECSEWCCVIGCPRITDGTYCVEHQPGAGP